MPDIILKIDNKRLHEYPVIIEKNIIKDIGNLIKNRIIPLLSLSPSNIAIITDSKVIDLYGKKVFNNILDNGFKAKIIDFPEGEENKTRNTKEKLEDFLLAENFGRDSLIIAVGGGVVGDVAGYVASTYNRGIPFIQVPTTVIAMVDSSIGGKTGVDVPQGKNLIGTFYQPSAVIISPETLLTLDNDQYIAGFSEIIKHAVIWDAKLFSLLEKNIDRILKRDIDLLTDIIHTNCEIKKAVVQADEMETNLRQILNFGHTIGHAIEKLSDFSVFHGQAVAIGMVIESLIAVKMNLLKQEQQKRITDLIQKIGLPVSVPDNINPDELTASMTQDKKARKGVPRFIIPEKIGKVYCKDDNYGIIVDEKIIKDVLRR